MAVSYTHLIMHKGSTLAKKYSRSDMHSSFDNYFDLKSAQKISEVVVNFWRILHARRNGKNKLTISAEAEIYNKRSIHSVSYTHLDVYKRQRYNSLSFLFSVCVFLERR